MFSIQLGFFSLFLISELKLQVIVNDGKAIGRMKERFVYMHWLSLHSGRPLERWRGVKSAILPPPLPHLYLGTPCARISSPVCDTDKGNYDLRIVVVIPLLCGVNGPVSEAKFPEGY